MFVYCLSYKFSFNHLCNCNFFMRINALKMHYVANQTSQLPRDTCKMSKSISLPIETKCIYIQYNLKTFDRFILIFAASDPVVISRPIISVPIKVNKKFKNYQNKTLDTMQCFCRLKG